MAIIALLAAIAFPIYGKYQQRSAERACLAEMTGYARAAITRVHDGQPPGLPPQQACETSEAVVDLATTPVTATPRAPGIQPVSCHVPTASCSLP